jgi:5'-nucleotidase/UDP-sugar diphosphatase
MASAKGGVQSYKLKSEIAKINSDALDGTEEAVRNRKGSNLTQFYSQAMLEEGNKGRPNPPPFTFALINAGTIRIDDKVGPGKVTFYEAVRIMPFGGNLATVEIKIADLAQILKRSWKDIPDGIILIL